jgi:myo-inositol-1(or 4)-monophosphatase
MVFMSTPEALLTLAADAAFGAGRLLLEGWPDVRSSVSTKSTRTDVVTAMDVASEKHIVATITAARPHDGFLGEEGASAVGTTGVRWIIDPLDGTVNYLYGLPAWAVSIAAEVDGEVVAGIVHAPHLGVTYTGVAGGQALRNGAAIACSSEKDLGLSLCGTGFAYDVPRRTSHGQVLARLMGQIRDIRRYGSAALDICAVADGSLDAYFERGPMEWDVAAGGLIACLAGAEVHREGDLIAVANGPLLSQLLALGLV